MIDWGIKLSFLLSVPALTLTAVKKYPTQVPSSLSPKTFMAAFLKGLTLPESGSKAENLLPPPLSGLHFSFSTRASSTGAPHSLHSSSSTELLAMVVTLVAGGDCG